MYNYNRDVLDAEYERSNRMTAASNRQVPYHLRTRNWKRTKGWLGQHIFQPAGASISGLLSTAGHQFGRYWRRSSSRAKGLLLNSIESLIPGRA
jgi:hypothetical protein